MPSLLNRTKGQLKSPAPGEELALERVVRVVEVTKLNIIKRQAVRYFSIFLLEIKKNIVRKCSTFIYNPQTLLGSLKFRTWCFPLTLYTEYEVIQTLDTWKLFNNTAGHGPQITPYFSLKYTNFSLENILPSFTILKRF